MNARTTALLSTLLCAGLLAGCGGGSSSGPMAPLPGGGGQNGGNAQSQQQQIQDSEGAANGVGDPIKEDSENNDALSSPAQQDVRVGEHVMTVQLGQCNNGVEFFAPDKNGDPDSTERIVFYDNACTEMATDTVRIYTSTGSNSETVQRTVTKYAMNGGGSAESVRSETVNYTSASFDKYGYPIVADGFDRTHTGELTINGVKTIDGDGEIVAEAASGGITNYCSDSAGFNATGNAQLQESFGWAGLTPSGTRTVNNDGSVTWAATPGGTTYVGPIGGLSIQAGTQNTSCPISTPMFTLAGGTVKGTYSIPMSVTFDDGYVSNLTVTNATLADGDTLNVQTNQGVSPGNTHYISGTLNNSSGVLVSTFNVNAFGDGVLTLASGTEYPIIDWHTVK